MFKTLRAFCSGLAVLAAPVMAQEPQLPQLIKLVVPFAAGASADAAARATATQLAKRVGSTVVVENLAGASTFIGTAAAAKGQKDGSVILLTTTSTWTAAATKRIVPVDVNVDLIPVALLSEGPLVVAASLQSGITTPADLISAAHAQPDGITHGTGGIASLPHLVQELLQDAAHIQMRHVPYKSASLAVSDFVAGRIDLMIGTYSTVASQVDAGRARLIAVNSREAHPSFPGVQTLALAVPAMSIEDYWVGFFVPTGTPSAVVQRLNREFNGIAKSKELRELMARDGAVPGALSPEQFGSRLREGYATWKKLAVAKNIVVE